MIKSHSLTAFGLIAKYAVQELINKVNAFQLVFILVLLAIAYAHVAWMLPKTQERALHKSG